MGQSASQAHAFYREVAENRVLWTCRDGEGFPQPMTSSGGRAQPFWSSLSRVQRIIKTVPTYGGFVPYELSWEDFVEAWVSDLKEWEVEVGINWSGNRAVGYDVEPDRVVTNVRYYIDRAETGDE